MQSVVFSSVFSHADLLPKSRATCYESLKCAKRTIRRHETQETHSRGNHQEAARCRRPHCRRQDGRGDRAAGRVSVPTYHRRKEQYGGADRSTVKRLKELEQENSRLKKLVADQALDNAMLKELVKGKW